MESGEGMVAVVRGLRDAGLAVTLTDGNRQYTLMPNYEASPVSHIVQRTQQAQQTQQTQQSQQTQHHQGYANVSTDSVSKCEAAAQATDGRYASTYKTAHCNVNPTSPPMNLSEFPPQRTQVNRGHENFQVGGTGSGDTGHYARLNDSYRGAMCWPDRGSVCAPRPSQEVDAFANSLRKYPNLSPDRSTEIVERLITYTQNKNATKNMQSGSHHSPTRVSDTDWIASSQNLNHSSRNSAKTQRLYETEVRRARIEEAPTRDVRCRAESPNRQILSKTMDIRYVRDSMSRRVKEIRYNSIYPYQQASPTFRERCDYIPTEHKRLQMQQTTNSVNMEIQADVKMVSREVATVPRADPPTRTVAVSHSTPHSAANSTTEGQVSHSDKIPYQSTDAFKSLQTTLHSVNQTNSRKSVQTTTSLTEMDNRWRCNENVRKSRSQEEFKDFNDDIVSLLKDVVLQAHKNDKSVADYKFGSIFKDDDFNTNVGGRFRFHIGRCDDDKSGWYHCKHIDEAGLRPRKRMRTDKSICVYRAEITPIRNKFCEKSVSKSDDKLENIIKAWVYTVEIKSRDFLGRSVDRKHIFNSITSRLKYLLNTKPKRDVLKSLKAEIIDIVKDIPIETRGRSNKWRYMNNVINILFNEVKTVFNNDSFYPLKRKIACSGNFSKELNNGGQSLFKFRKYIQPTEDELKEFIVIEMLELVEKFHLTINFDSWDDIETELTDILLDSMDAIRRNDDSEVKNEIITVLIELAGIPQQESIRFANILIEHLKDLFRVIDKKQVNDLTSQTFVVMPGFNDSRHYQTRNNDKFDSSIGGISDRDIEANFNAYTNQLAQHIEDWLINLHLPGVDAKGRHVVAIDLAGDIVDRQKYLELNPGSRGSNDDELKHLKYQIFKWVNKLTGDDSTVAVENAPQLMQKIQSIPVPMLTRPNGDVSRQMSHLQSPSSSPNQTPMFGFGNSMIERGRGSISNRRMSSPGVLSAGPQMTSTPYNTDSRYGPAGGSVIQPARDLPSNRRLSSPGSIPYRPMQVINEGAEYPAGQSNGNIQNLPNQVGAGSAASGSQTNISLTPTFKQTNDEYEAFLNSWVREIPIQATTPEEQSFADKVRQGILNGIWKSLAKVRSNPDKYYDTFHIQDVLDDDIEELLDLLPQSQELVAKKFNLKNKLISKTTGTTKKLKLLVDPSCYKEELIDKFLRVWPRRTVTKTDDEDPIKLYEELQALKLVEDFILYIRYKNDDKIKSNVYKNKLLKNVKELVENVKVTHGKDLQDIDSNAYVNDIFAELHKVPIPNDETIREEADEILLGLEVDQWYTDLPLIESDDPEEHLKRRRLRDALVKRIYSMEREGTSSNSNVEDELKVEASRFLNKMPIPQDESLNINFMVEELANRVKNRPKTPSPRQDRNSGRRKSVAFDATVSYDDFSRVMPCCSSFSELPGTRQAQVNETPQSIYMRDATRSSIDYSEHIGNKPAPPRPLLLFPRNLNPPLQHSFHESQQEWFTLHETGAPIEAAPPTAPPIQCSQIPIRTYHDSASQLQVNQSGLCSSQMQVHIPQEPVAIRLDSMRQSTCNHCPMKTSQQLNQSAQLGQQSQQGTCGSQQSFRGQQQIPNQLLIQPQNQSIPLGQMVEQATCGTQLTCQSVQQQIPNQHSMQNPQQFNQSVPIGQLVQQVCRPQLSFQGQFQQIIPQPANQSIRSQPTQKSCCGTQSPSQSPIQVEEQVQNRSIACQTPQSCVPTPRTPQIAGVQTSRGILGTSQVPGPSGVPCSQIASASRMATAPCTRTINQPSASNLNVPCATGTTPSAFGQPMGHSTPQNAIPQEFPPKIIRKRPREPQRQRDRARRHIDLEQLDEDDENYDDDDESDTDFDEPCRCMGRFRETPVTEDHKSRFASIREEDGHNENTRTMSINMKSVQTASSLINIGSPKRDDKKELSQSKSQDLITRKSDIKIQEDVLEWFQVESNKLRVKMWGKKLKRIAQRLQTPGEEEKLKFKMEKYLKHISSQFPERDEDKECFRRQLPNHIIRMLKKFYIKYETSKPISVYQVEVPKYYNKNEIELRNVIKIWLKGIYFKRTDYLGRSIKREDIIDFIDHKVQHLINNRHSSEDNESILKRDIKDMINELPILVENNSRIDFVSKQTDRLVNLLLNNDFINKSGNEMKLEEPNLQYSIKEIKEFASREIATYLQNTRIEVSNNRMVRLEADLTKVLLNPPDSLDDNGCELKNEVYIVMKYVGKFTNLHAKLFASSLIDNYRRILNTKSIKPERIKTPQNSKTYIVYNVQDKPENSKNNAIASNVRRLTESDMNANKNQYTMVIFKLIQEWLANIKIPIALDEGFLHVAVKDLAGDIVDRHKYLQLNPGTRGSDEEELEYLKYQIYKWIYHLVGEETDIVKHAPDLMQRIHNIPDPFFNTTQDNADSNVPNQITSTPHEDEVIDPKQEKIRIRRYEDIIDDWIDNVPKPKKSESIFTNTRNEHVHELAVNINNIKHKITGIPANEVANKLKDAVVEWIKSLPLHPQASKSSNRDDIADSLVQRIQRCNIDEYVLRDRQDNRVPRAAQVHDPQVYSDPKSEIVRDVIINWSRNLPLKAKYCPREFSSLIDRMAVEITKLLTNPKYSTVGENGKEIMKTIFLYLRDFPIKTENQIHEQLSRMAYILWRHFIDMNLCNDGSDNSSMYITKKPTQAYDRPLNFKPQNGRPDLNTSQEAGPSCNNASCKSAAAGSQNIIVGPCGQSNVIANKVCQLPENQPNALPNRNMGISNNFNCGPTNEIPMNRPCANTENPCFPRTTNPVDLPNCSDIPQGMQPDELLSYYKVITSDLCKQLPFPPNVPEADVEIYRNIMQVCITSTFDTVAADNVVGNDYPFVEYIFEHKINELLKEYPQSPELSSIREAWISKVLAHVMNSLRYLQGLVETSSFREQLRLGFKRHVVRENIQKSSDKNLQYCIGVCIDNFILCTKYKEQDPVKANFYRQRLTKSLEELAKAAAMPYNNNFYELDVRQIQTAAVKFLSEVPEPDSKILEEEAQQILLKEEVEKWYRALPMVPMKSGHEVMQQRMIELLCKKIYSLEKRMDLDASSLDREIKHEVTVFLEKQGKLLRNEDLNINPMVDELVNILKSRENKPKMLGYTSFEAGKPISSSLAYPPFQCTGHMPAASSTPCPAAVGPSCAASNGLHYSPVYDHIQSSNSQGVLSPGQAVAAPGIFTGQIPAASTTPCSAAVRTEPSRSCGLSYQPAIGQQLTAESGTQISLPCSRRGLAQVGGSSQTGQMTSTARVVSPSPAVPRPRELEEESQEKEEERRKRCRCKERLRRRRRCFYPGDDDWDSGCYPMSMPFPYRCFY